MKTCFLALSLLGASLASAQQSASTTPAPAPRPHGRPNGNFEQTFEQHLATRLGLNATQQNALHTALMESRTQRQGMDQQRQTLHTSMTAAIKAGNTGQIEALSQQLGALHQQEMAIHANTAAKVYATLTPAQQTKVGAHPEMLGGPGGAGFGPGPGPRMGRRGGAPPAQGTTPNQ
jgi:Spy/CpxP family protein refolding chaperone